MAAHKKLFIIAYSSTACLYILIFLWMKGVFGSIAGDEMGVWILGLYVVIPAVTLATGIKLGVKGPLSKWLYPIIAGAGAYLIPCIVSGTFSFDAVPLFFTFASPALGVALGSIISFRRRRSDL